MILASDAHFISLVLHLKSFVCLLWLCCDSDDEQFMLLIHMIDIVDTPPKCSNCTKHKSTQMFIHQNFMKASPCTLFMGSVWRGVVASLVSLFCFAKNIELRSIVNVCDVAEPYEIVKCGNPSHFTHSWSNPLGKLFLHISLPLPLSYYALQRIDHHNCNTLHCL